MKRNTFSCWLVLLGLLSFLIDLSTARAADFNPAEFDQAIGKYIQAHCVKCHNAETKEGEFRVDSLSKNVGIEDTALWAEVRERISSGEMPPEDVENRPSADQSNEIVKWLTLKIEEGEQARMSKMDRVSFHRLSREEYVNTIYDLIGVHFDATDPGGFSDDPQWQGFERIGSILSLSPNHIEKYFMAAETVLTEAYPDKPPEEFKVLKEGVAARSISEPYKSQLEAKGLLDKVRYDIWPGDLHRHSNPGRLPVPGVYEVRVKLSGLKPKDGRAPRMKFYHEKLDRVLFIQDVVAPEDKPIIITFQAHLPEGSQSIHLFNDVPGPSILPRSGRHGRKPFVSIKDGRIPWQLKLTDEEGDALYPFLILDWTEWRGPIVTDQEQALRDDYMPTEEGNMEQVRAGLTKLAERAFRRPLYEGEIDQYVSVVESEMAAGAKFLPAVKTGMLPILCSKSFLFVVEGTADSDRQQLNHWEIATRLAYFLWSTMPDEELFAVAEKGLLHKKEELKKQVDRMLADPKAKRFAESFPRQWLELQKVGMFPPDEKLYPKYDKHLEQSMIGETTAFFAEVLEKNLTLREFLDSDWTMVNPRLASFYGIPDVTGDTFQRVSLKPEYHRGGLLTQASILSLTSDGQRHRPVHRGVWLSKSIFGKTPPPPPANVDAIEPNPVDAPKATVRMKIEAHRDNPSCASCHKGIDPLGIAFENFDAIGAWRTEEVVQRGVGANPKVDPSGEMPDGRKFANADEFKSLLLSDLDAFNATFIEKLATYGLRRAMTFEDQKDLDAIAETAKKDDYKLRSIVEEFVLSDLFQKR